MVTVVRELPREVRDAKGGVGEEADNIVESLVLGEGAMACLVGQNPKTGTDETLDEAVYSPGNGPDCKVGDCGDVSHSSPSKRPSENNVADEVAHRSSDGRLEAMLGNGISQGVDVGILRCCRLRPALSYVSRWQPSIFVGDSSLVRKLTLPSHWLGSRPSSY